MSRQDYMKNERMIRKAMNKKIRRRNEIRRHILKSIFTLIIVVSLSASVGGMMTRAHEKHENPGVKYYKSIMIMPNDTLYDLAKTNIDYDYYESVEDYMQEVCHINSLNSDKIYAGNYLIVPYWE